MVVRLTAVGDSPREADATNRRVWETLLAEPRSALEDDPKGLTARRQCGRYGI
jgi:hypothetical protein